MPVRAAGLVRGHAACPGVALSRGAIRVDGLEAVRAPAGGRALHELALLALSLVGLEHHQSASWQGSDLDCEIRDCGELLVRGALVSCLHGTTFGSACDVSCPEGHDGAPGTYVCDASGACALRDDGAVAATREGGVAAGVQCVARECGPLVVELAEMSCSGMAFGDSCKARCDHGFEGGAAEYDCDADGQWVLSALRPDGFAFPKFVRPPPGSNMTFGCDRISCGALEVEGADVEGCDGDVAPSELGLGGTCTAACRAGHDGGIASYTCNDEREWVGELECAVRDCGPLEVQHADVDCNSTTFNSTCAATCHTGYDGDHDNDGTDEDSEVFVCGERGEWEGGLQCEAVVCGYLEVDGGVAACEEERLGARCTVECATESFGGQTTYDCNADGQWHGDIDCRGWEDCLPGEVMLVAGDLLSDRQMRSASGTRSDTTRLAKHAE